MSLQAIIKKTGKISRQLTRKIINQGIENVKNNIRFTDSIEVNYQSKIEQIGFPEIEIMDEINKGNIENYLKNNIKNQEYLDNAIRIGLVKKNTDSNYILTEKALSATYRIDGN